jgi:transcription elongation factor GreA
MMEPESLVKLAASGNTATVEEEWMRLVESAGAASSDLSRYHPVLAELQRVGKASFAEQLAWTAIETVRDGISPTEALRVAGPFLLAVGDGGELRAQVAQLYRTAFADRDQIDSLLTESGLRAGRPVRRALRTLDVCLGIQEGSFLISREGDAPARVDRIDRSNWEFEITVGDGTEALGAVHLADRFAPASAQDWRVLLHFAPQELTSRLDKDPGGVVIDLCRQHGDQIDGEKLESLLVPAAVAEKDWKRWFARARAALKSSPHVKIEGRSPYQITYVDAPRTPDEEFLTEFAEHRDTQKQLALVERFIRDCKARKQTPSTDALRSCYQEFHDRAARWDPPGALEAGWAWLAARRVGEVLGVQGAAQSAVAWFQALDDPAPLLRQASPAMMESVCQTIIEARPHDWRSHFLRILPSLSVELCDAPARKLVQAGLGLTEFEPVVQRILATPIPCFDALLWLWDGPADEEKIIGVPPLTLLTRILRTLEECRRTEQVSKDAAKRISHAARSVLAARKGERFARCLNTIDPNMAVALRTQLLRLENLGRAVRDDLVNLIRQRFPSTEAPRAAVAPWNRTDVLYVTARALSKKQSEIEHHVNVKMKENARAIGRAAELGDLSENSEYKFALEERDLLRARLAQMNAEVSKARVLKPDEVPADHVGIGNRVALRRVGDGLDYQITFVGPWEADASKGWYNYLAPMAQGILGKRIGEQVEFNHSGATGIYEIIEIHNGLLTEETADVV